MSKLFLFAFFSLVLLSALSFSASSESTNLSEWKMFGRYLNHTAWDGVSFPNIGLNRINVSLGGVITSSAIISNGSVYVSNWNGYLYQLNASNISQTLSTFYSPYGSEFRSSPIVVGNYLYIGSLDNHTYQLNASNISIQIANFTADSQISASPILFNNSIYISSHGGIVYQLNASNVSIQIANFTSSGPIISSVASAGDFIYVGGYDDVIYQLDASNISIQIANYTTGYDIISAPAVSNDFVYVSGIDNNVYQLNASNISQAIGVFSTGLSIESSPLVAGGYVYIPSTDYSIYQLNASNISGTYTNSSTFISKFNGTNSFGGSPSFSDGFVYVADYSGILYQLNASNISTQINNFTAINTIISTPAIAGGYIYFGDESGFFYQLNASNISLVNPFVSISFSSPTPDSNSTIFTSSITVNASVSSLPLSHYTFTDLDRSLVLWLTMDNFSSGVPVDISSYSQNISNFGASQTGSGYWGDGLDIDGSYLSLSRPVSDDFTICAWINTTSFGFEDNHWRSAVIFESESANPQDDFGFGIGASGTLIFGHGDYSQNADYTVVGSVVVNDSQWHLACATRDQSTSQMSVFVDGIKDANATGSNASLTSNPVALIGAGSDGGAQLTGTIDDLLVFNRVLADSEILALYNSSNYSANFSSLTLGTHNITSYSVNLDGIVSSPSSRLFTIASSPVPESSSKSSSRIYISLTSNCSENTITSSVPRSQIRVTDLDGGEVILDSSSGSTGTVVFNSCSKSVRVFASKSSHRSISSIFDLEDCSCLNSSSSNSSVFENYAEPLVILENISPYPDPVLPPNQPEQNLSKPGFVGPLSMVSKELAIFNIHFCSNCILTIKSPSGNIISFVPSNEVVSFEPPSAGEYVVSLISEGVIVQSTTLVATSAPLNSSNLTPIKKNNSVDSSATIAVLVLSIVGIGVLYFVFVKIKN